MDDGGDSRNLLADHHLQLVLHLHADVSCDASGQLIGGALEAVNHLLQLSQEGVPVLLLPLLHVGLQLLYVCNHQPESGVQ